MHEHVEGGQQFGDVVTRAEEANGPFEVQFADVRAEFVDILRFWLDRGVDGFRVDVAHGLVKDEGMPDWHERAVMAGSEGEAEHNLGPMWDQGGVHEIYRGWRRVLEEYNPTGDPQLDRILVAEAWLPTAQETAKWVRPDEMHQAFNFDYLDTHWDAATLRDVIEASLEANDAVGAPATWVLSNHDVLRHASRFGLPQDAPRPNGIGAGDPQPDAELAETWSKFRPMIEALGLTARS